MGRTLHYHIFGDFRDGAVPMRTRQQIQHVERQMNESFTWTCEPLWLDFYASDQLAGYADNPPLTQLAWGFTKVRDDEWNAALAVRFLTWVSTELPDKAFVRLFDEGGYVLPGHVIIHHGEFALDEAEITRQRQFLSANSCGQRLAELEASIVAAGRDGRWIRDVSAIEYTDRPEIEKKCYATSMAKLHKLTLEDIADRMSFPWQEAKRRAA